MEARAWGWVVLALVCLAYLPSLWGGWVWDDWYQVAENPSLGDPLTLITSDVWSTTGVTRSDIYRPLFLLSFWPGQALFPGPLVERLVSLGLHLAAVSLVASATRSLGTSQAAAWFAAALFGLHPAGSEAVAWISARNDLLPTVLCLAAWRCWLSGRRGLAGVLLAFTPFCKESFLVAPALLGVWMLGERRFSLRGLVAVGGGSILYVLVRTGLDLPLPASSLDGAFVSAAGGGLRRLLELLLLPYTADALPQLAPSVVLGGAAVLLGLALLVLSWGRPAVAGLTAVALTMVPSVLASAQLGLIADRYTYVLLGPLAVLAAIGLGGRCARSWLWILPVGLGILTGVRAGDWTSDQRLFSASLARDPTNSYAAFHLAYDLHTRHGDCAGAVPLYQLGLEVDARAGTNLLACLVSTGRAEEAATLGPELFRAHPESAPLAVNTARALSMLGRVEAAELWCHEALSLAPERCDLWIMLGNLLGLQGRLDEAGVAFQQAHGLGGDCRGEAEHWLGVIEAQRAATPTAP